MRLKTCLYLGCDRRPVGRGYCNLLHHGDVEAVFKPGTAKLDEKKVEEIRRKLKDGVRTVDIAKEYGVVPSTIHQIKIGRTWVTHKRTDPRAGAWRATLAQDGRKPGPVANAAPARRFPARPAA
jgi:hypothetical protein